MLWILTDRTTAAAKRSTLSQGFISGAEVAHEKNSVSLFPSTAREAFLPLYMAERVEGFPNAIFSSFRNVMASTIKKYVNYYLANLRKFDIIDISSQGQKCSKPNVENGS